MARGKKLSDAYVELRAEDSKLGTDVKVKATKAAKGFGATLNRQLAALRVDPVDIKADPKSAIAAIEATRARLRAMSDEAETVEVRIRVERAISQLDRFRKSIGDVGGEAAAEFGLSFSQRVGPLIARAPVGAGLLAGVVAAAPAVSSAVAGAVTVGVAGGAVGAGLLIAARDPRVKAAGQLLGKEFTDAITLDAAAFVPETLKALSFVRREFQGWRPILRDVFADASSYVQPLTRALTGFVSELAPDIRDAVRNAQPLIDMLEVQIPHAGALAGAIISDLSTTAAQSADTIAGILAATEASLSVAGKIATLLSGDVGTLLGLGPLQLLGDLTSKGEESTGEWAEQLQILAGSIAATGSTAATAARDVETYSEMLRRMSNENLSAEQASIRLEQAIDDATAAAKANGDGIDANIPKQRENRQALLDIASAGLAARDAILEQTGSEDLAAAATERAREAFLKTAHAMGVEKGEALALANQLFGIPRQVTTRADFTGDNKGVSDWKRTLSGIPREIFTSARLRAIVNVEVRREQATSATGRRRGGIDYVGAGAYAAMSGGIAKVWPASSPPLVKFAEPETGGEAWIPRRGSRERALAILAEAAGWHDAAVVPAARGLIAADVGAVTQPLPRPARSAAVAAGESWPQALIADLREVAALLQGVRRDLGDVVDAVTTLPPGLATALLGRGLSPQLAARMR